MSSKSKPKRVLISYSHDDERHEQWVLGLSNRLRREGVDAWIDQYVQGPAEGWLLWMQREVVGADFVVIVCTAQYRRRFDEPGAGEGVAWEGKLLRQLLNDGTLTGEHVLPVLLETTAEQDIPLACRDFMRYRLLAEYEPLYRRITGQPAVTAPDLGPLRVPDPLPEPNASPRIQTTNRRPVPAIPAPPSKTQHAELVARIGKLLASRPRVIDALAKARWASAAALGPDALAEAMLAEQPPSVLPPPFLAAIRDLRARANPVRADVEVAMEIFEYALPYVVGQRSCWTRDEDGLWPMGHQHPQTLEPEEAWAAQRKLHLRPHPEAGEHPIPEYYVPIDADEIAEWGVTDEERIEVIGDDFVDRVEARYHLLPYAFFKRHGGLRQYKRLPWKSKLVALNSMLKRKPQTFFALARDASKPGERTFLTGLVKIVEQLRVVLPQLGDGDDDLREEYELMEGLNSLYAQWHQVRGDAP
ncbi:MAG: toll/interleukin-1 receptor domain-containing protein [Nannocystaceae bacterium]